MLISRYALLYYIENRDFIDYIFNGFGFHDRKEWATLGTCSKREDTYLAVTDDIPI
jgi:hypothetical protein